jgi:hypothetical protein
MSIRAAVLLSIVVVSLQLGEACNARGTNS